MVVSTGAGTSTGGASATGPSDLKIDISFVRTLLDSDDDRRVVERIIGIAERFGLRTIAEGIEDAATLEVLARARRRLRAGLPPRPSRPARHLGAFRAIMRRWPTTRISPTASAS